MPANINSERERCSRPCKVLTHDIAKMMARIELLVLAHKQGIVLTRSVVSELSAKVVVQTTFHSLANFHRTDT